MFHVILRLNSGDCREEAELELSRAAPEVGAQPAQGFSYSGRHIAGFKAFEDEASLLHKGDTSSSHGWRSRCPSPQPVRGSERTTLSCRSGASARRCYHPLPVSKSNGVPYSPYTYPPEDIRLARGALAVTRECVWAAGMAAEWGRSWRPAVRGSSGRGGITPWTAAGSMLPCAPLPLTPGFWDPVVTHTK